MNYTQKMVKDAQSRRKKLTPKFVKRYRSKQANKAVEKAFNYYK